MTLSAVADFVASWRGIATGVSALLILIGADGRKTAIKLETHLNQEVPALLQAQRKVDAKQDSVLDAVEGLALAECLRQREPVARAALDCGRRETQAGVRR